MFQGAFARASDTGRTPPEHRGELTAVLLGHAEQVGDDEQAVRSGELADELAAARRERRRLTRARAAPGKAGRLLVDYCAGRMR